MYKDSAINKYNFVYWLVPEADISLMGKKRTDYEVYNINKPKLTMFCMLNIEIAH